MTFRIIATVLLSSFIAAASAAPAHDGSHDFDFELGTWKTHVKRLVKPLTGSTMTTPTVGRFKDGRGEFFNDDTLGDKPIRVRFVITPLSPTSIRFEQAFSADQGKTWEVNWIATDTKVATND